MNFIVDYEVRKIGAIGAFWILSDEVTAPREDLATEAFRAKHAGKYEFRCPVKIAKALDAQNKEILAQRVALLEKVAGPRVGDYVRFCDGVERRISYIWDFAPKSVQTCDACAGGFYLGTAYVSFSGSLYRGVSGDSLRLTSERKRGGCWLFDHDFHGKGRGIDVSIEFRVYDCDERAPTS